MTPYSAWHPIAYVHRPLPLSDQRPCMLSGVGIGTVIARTELGGMTTSLDVRVGGLVHRGCAPADVRDVPGNVLAFPARLRTMAVGGMI